jgi:hypothetical protein
MLTEYTCIGGNLSPSLLSILQAKSIGIISFNVIQHPKFKTQVLASESLSLYKFLSLERPFLLEQQCTYRCCQSRILPLGERLFSNPELS